MICLSKLSIYLPVPAAIGLGKLIPAVRLEDGMKISPTFLPGIKLCSLTVKRSDAVQAALQGYQRWGPGVVEAAVPLAIITVPEL